MCDAYPEEDRGGGGGGGGGGRRLEVELPARALRAEHGDVRLVLLVFVADGEECALAAPVRRHGAALGAAEHLRVLGELVAITQGCEPNASAGEDGRRGRARARPQVSPQPASTETTRPPACNAPNVLHFGRAFIYAPVRGPLAAQTPDRGERFGGSIPPASMRPLQKRVCEGYQGNHSRPSRAAARVSKASASSSCCQ
jgi:hypothetical protein